MSRPLRIEYEGAFYHITARGNERKEIFKDDKDKDVMLDILCKLSIPRSINIYAYVLMTNHYHFLIETMNANLTRFMHSFQTIYTSGYNKRHRRTGHLFQGRYKALLVEKNEYLLELTRYIHLNPVRARIVKSPEQFKYSSYCHYMGLEKSNAINPNFLLDQFDSKNTRKAILQYRDFVEEGIANNIKSPFDDLRAGFILGSETFYQKTLEKIDSAQLSSEMPECSIKNENVRIDRIKEIILEEYHIQEQDLFKKRGNLKPLKLAMYLARTLTDMPISEIAKELGNRHYSLVSHFTKQIKEEIKRDNDFAGFVRDIEKRIRANSQFKT